MKKIITLLYFQICVDILGFPIYYHQIKTTWETKKNNNTKVYCFNNNKNTLIETKLIKQL